MIIHYILGELLPLVFFVCTGTFVGVSAGRSYGRRRDRRARALAEARADEYSHSFLKAEDREYFETWDRILSIHTRPEPAPTKEQLESERKRKAESDAIAAGVFYDWGSSDPVGGSKKSHTDVGSSFYSEREEDQALAADDQAAFERRWDAEAKAKGYSVPIRDGKPVVELKSRTPKEQREIARNERWLADRNRKALSTIGAVESHTEAISSISEATDAIDMLGDMITVIRGGLAVIIPEAMLEIGDQVIPTAPPPVIEQASHYHEMLKKEAETVQLLRAENERIHEQIAQLRKLHLDVKARELAVSSDDSPEEKLRKLREYRRSRRQAQYGITPRSTDS